jgi:exosome complex component RRP41
MPKSGMVSLLQMDGSLTEDEFKQALDMSIDACRRIYEMQREALKQKYHIVKDEADNEAATEVRV